MAGCLRWLVRPVLRRNPRKLAVISIPIVYCASLHEDKEKHVTLSKELKIDLSHEALIRQACTLSVNSSSQVLTQVLVAIAEAGEEYRKAVLHLMQILDDSILILSNGNSQQQEEISEMILTGRTAVEQHQKALRELTSLMEYVEKLATSTAETAFLAGAENSSTIICERLNSALQKIKEEQTANKKAEEELLLLQQAYIIQVTESQKRDSKCRPEQDEEEEGKEEEKDVS